MPRNYFKLEDKSNSTNIDMAESDDELASTTTVPAHLYTELQSVIGFELEIISVSAGVDISESEK